MNMVDNKWIFRDKQNYDGSIQIYKAHLVAKGVSKSLIMQKP